MNRLTILQKIIDKIGVKTYLEIGVQTGKIISQLKGAEKKIGVDPGFNYTMKVRVQKTMGLVKFKAIEVTSDKFFESYASKILANGIDLAFVDGMHTYKQVLKDIENCLKYLNDEGIIVVHDCNPLNFASAYPVKNSISEVHEIANRGDLAGWNNAWHGDVWKAIAHLQIEHDDLKVFTLDLDCGLGVIAKGKNSKLSGFTIEQIQKEDYYFLERNRQVLLNLKAPKFIDEFLVNRNVV